MARYVASLASFGFRFPTAPGLRCRIFFPAELGARREGTAPERKAERRMTTTIVIIYFDAFEQATFVRFAMRPVASGVNLSRLPMCAGTGFTRHTP